MTVNNYPVGNYQISNPIARVGFDLEYELQLARVEMGITLDEFNRMRGTQIWCPNGELCKSELLVLYRLSQQTEAVGNDIQKRHLERSRKRK